MFSQTPPEILIPGGPAKIFFRLLPVCQRTPPSLALRRTGLPCRRPNEDCRGVDPQSGPPLSKKKRRRSSLYHYVIISLVTKILLWSYSPECFRENPRSTASQCQRPCTTSLNQHSTSKALNNQNQNTLWSYRDSNPGPLPCKGSALAS